ncbi:MAG TPA: hypothetical protein VKU82_14680 [Planctomycetaceae bacterium]|nr:hypothetical protein [Planctomycetaceae bacterium]
MPTYMELQKRIKRQNAVRGHLGTEEELINDARGQMRSGEFIEQKLRVALRSSESGRASAAHGPPHRLNS